MVFVLSKRTTNDGTDQKIGRVKLRRVHLWGLLPLVSSQMWYYDRDMDIRVPPSYGSMGCLVEYIMIWILRVPKSYIKWYEILEVEFSRCLGAYQIERRQLSQCQWIAQEQVGFFHQFSSR